MANLKVYEQVDVSLPGCHYPIIICHNGMINAELLHRFVTSQQVLIVTNETIAPLYLSSLTAAFSAVQCDVVTLADGEEYKNQDSLFAIYDALVQKKHHRDTTIIALGGGVVGDLAGFAASTYQRGVPFVQIPTTLLAQIDASVGGKTAINHPAGKNMIGSFYQPQAVIIDLNALKTLPEREFKSGLAEMIKYGLLAGGQFLEELQGALKQGLTVDHPLLPKLIAACCRIKAEFVEADEKELGQRALLNLGHTFAHALEAQTNYQHWLHGEAVAIGLYCAAVLSRVMGLIDEPKVKEIESMLVDAGLDYKIPSFIDLSKIRELMNADKKIKNNCLRFVVIRRFGECYLDDKITEDCLHNTLMTVVAGE